MDLKKYMFIIKGDFKDDISSYRYEREKNLIWIRYFGMNKEYSYSAANVKLLSEPKMIDCEKYIFSSADGKRLDNICEVYEFKDRNKYYYRIFFEKNYHKNYKSSDLIIVENLIKDAKVSNLFEYYKSAAHYNSLKDDNGKVLLESIYEKFKSIEQNTVLAAYLKGMTVKKSVSEINTIFPFGCNFSQIAAVENALSSQISIIEGPPGTGKTQTILNIIANIVTNGKTVMVVSNNNPATDNVFEKLQKYGYGYIAAQMGSSENKTDFIKNKQTPYPDFSDFPIIENDHLFNLGIRETIDKLKSLFKKKNRLAELNTIISELTLEQKYFLDYYNSSFEDTNVFKKDRFSSDALIRLWTELQQIRELSKEPGLFKRLKYKFKYGFTSIKALSSNSEDMIANIKKLYYEHKLYELKNEADSITNELNNNDMNELMKKLGEESQTKFRSKLREKYNNGTPRRRFDENYWKDPYGFLREYPVLLSTTFSSRSCFKDIMYDYVIVDEASQVDLTCGVLAMSCAKNIVIVGDLKQLPNVVTPKDRMILSKLSQDNDIPDKYRCEEQSLLSSACEVFADAPRTLLREHYRCHPKIINFCNKKFYNDQLIIMTADNGENDVLKAHITAAGNHARGRYNQRQIDEIKQVILPELASNDVGIIAPYNAQTNALTNALSDQIPIYTVHKFQGRENDDIIISTVDNEISEFTDDPNMLNVAVSRAKKRLRIVVSDNENNKNTNIGELVRYIQYNNFEVHKSELYSVFDMLYKDYEEKRREYLKNHKRISEYESENLMYALIEDVLKDERFTKLDVISHLPLGNIIRDLHLLDDEEVKYVMNPMTHIDFVIYGKIDKTILIAIEVDGYSFHKEGTRQHERDEMKNKILEKYKIPFIRFSTTGSGEKERLEALLKQVLEIKE